MVVDEGSATQKLWAIPRIDGSTFEEIAELMHYSWRWVLKLHRQALQRLEIAHGCS